MSEPVEKGELIADRGRSPLVRGALLAWPLVLIACAQGTNDEGEPDAFGQDAAASEGIESGADENADDVQAVTETGAPLDPDGGSPDGEDVGDSSAAGQDDATTDAPGEDSTTSGGLDAVAEAPADGPACGCAPQSVCVAGTCTAARRVFVSNEIYDGALGGYAGADATCQTLAGGAGLGGTWMAWISDSTSSPSERFSRPTVGYYLLDGSQLAASWTDLTTHGLAHAIDLSETGVSQDADTNDGSKTWTGTLYTGVLSASSCTDFTSGAASVSGTVGHCTGDGDDNWTSATTDDCDVANHLYCFEQ